MAKRSGFTLIRTPLSRNLVNVQGFTLIELMIVITIIAILSAIGLVMYGQFTKSARDAKRQSDLKFIQSALEDYHADNLSYPIDLATLTTGRVYITQIPVAPVSGSYNYATYPSSCTGLGSSACTSYCLSINLEISKPNECGTTPSITSGDNYGVTRP